MSMLDSFLNKGFKGSKCKTLLKLTIPRIKLLRNRREIQIKQMRKDIAKLLEAGQEATARIRVEHIIREENMMAAQEIIELFCELISVRLPIIESQRECPLDLKEAISSICFAAPRCADLPELLQVQLAFVSKYGKEFVTGASELLPDCGVNRQLVELLSVRAPSAEKKLKLLKEIAEEHEIDWDPAPSETEFFKAHEDLLNGPTQFISGSKVPLPKENVEILQSTSVHGTGSSSEEEFDELEFPEVPKMPLRPSAGEEIAAPPSAPHPDTYQSNSYSDSEIPLQSAQHELPKASAIPEMSKQFVPFIIPAPTQTQPGTHIEPPSLSASADSTNSLSNSGTTEQFVPFIAPVVTEPRKAIDSPSTLSPNVDLNDVLAAAKAAAESADRAATAARAAASLVELRISELYRSKSGPDLENGGSGFQVDESCFDNPTENPFHASNLNLSTEMGNLQVEDSFVGDDVMNPGIKINRRENVSVFTTDGVTDLESSHPADKSFKQEFPSMQPRRIPSMDDESVFTYPNLFNSQGGNMPSDYPSFDNSYQDKGRT